MQAAEEDRAGFSNLRACVGTIVFGLRGAAKAAHRRKITLQRVPDTTRWLVPADSGQDLKQLFQARGHEILGAGAGSLRRSGFHGFMRVDLFVTQRDERENRVGDAGLFRGRRVRSTGRFPSGGNAHLVFQFHHDPLRRFFPDAFDLRQRRDVAGDDACLETRDRRPAKHIERSLRPNAANVSHQEAKQVPLCGADKAVKHVRILSDRQMREDFKLRAGRWKLVVARKRNEHMISNPADIHNNLRRQRFGECAAQVMDHGPTGSRAARLRARKNPVFTFWVVLVLVLSAPVARAGEPWFLLPEPKFMGHQVTQPIPGAKRTVLAAAQMGNFGIEFARREPWDALGVTDSALLEAARKQAAEWLKQLKPDLVRNEQKVVQYATLQSDSVPVAATVLAPEFWRQFEEVFGPNMRVVIPNRHTVFIFPDLEGDLTQYSRMVIEAWRSRWPKVSLEVFELTERGLKAVGAFEEP
jgi:hypothetical protein